MHGYVFRIYDILRNYGDDISLFMNPFFLKHTERYHHTIEYAGHFTRYSGMHTRVYTQKRLVTRKDCVQSILDCRENRICTD